jgi:hypothetical protein
MLPWQATVHNCMFNNHTFQALGLFIDTPTSTTRVEDMVAFMLIIIANSAMSMVTR